MRTCGLHNIWTEGMVREEEVRGVLKSGERMVSARICAKVVGERCG